jgi:hypothetical protein
LDDCHVVAAHRQCGAEVFDMAVAPCHFRSPQSRQRPCGG